MITEDIVPAFLYFTAWALVSVFQVRYHTVLMIKYHTFFIITGGRLRLKPNLSQSFLSQGRGSHRLPLKSWKYWSIYFYLWILSCWLGCPRATKQLLIFYENSSTFSSQQLCYTLKNLQPFSRRCSLWLCAKETVFAIWLVNSIHFHHAQRWRLCRWEDPVRAGLKLQLVISQKWADNVNTYSERLQMALLKNKYSCLLLTILYTCCWP